MFGENYFAPALFFVPQLVQKFPPPALLRAGGALPPTGAWLLHRTQYCLPLPVL